MYSGTETILILLKITLTLVMNWWLMTDDLLYKMKTLEDYKDNSIKMNNVHIHNDIIYIFWFIDWDKLSL